MNTKRLPENWNKYGDCMKSFTDLLSKVFPEGNSIKISIIFFGTVFFELLVALPVFYKLSRQIGIVLLLAILFVFVSTDAYIVYKFIKYFLKKKDNDS
jgi:hypothetical protein